MKNINKTINVLMVIAIFAFAGIMFIHKTGCDLEQANSDLDMIILDLKDGEVMEIYNDKYCSLFTRLESQLIKEHSSVVELGLRTYAVSQINDSHILQPVIQPTHNNYYLEITHQAIKISPVEDYLNLIFIKKVYGSVN